MTSPLRTLARRLGVMVALALPLVLSPALVVSAPPAQAAVAPSAATVAAYEARVIHLINVTRATNHRVAVAASACPDRYAESWGAYLARTGAFVHQSMTPILNGCRATRATENLARGYTSADATYIAWMRSPGHRANILDAQVNRIGVAAVYAGGRWTVVADFTRA